MIGHRALAPGGSPTAVVSTSFYAHLDGRQTKKYFLVNFIFVFMGNRYLKPSFCGTVYNPAVPIPNYPLKNK